MSDAAEPSILVFDRRAVRRHRDRAAAGFANHDFLKREVVERLADRLLDVRRRFPAALDLGSHDGLFARMVGDRGGIAWTVSCDLSDRFAGAAPGPAIVADEEFLPFRADSFDLAVSALSLHWVNDLPGALLQIRRALKPDGLFLACLPGAGTLRELREAWLAAEAELEGGAGPRVSPFVELRDAGHLLQRAGFALPVADAETLTVTYPNALALMRELAAMGESNALRLRRPGPTRRDTLARAAAIYESRFGGPDGRIPATFELVFLSGWKPHESQQKPLKPGQARARLADALGTAERSAGEKAGG